MSSSSSSTGRISSSFLISEVFKSEEKLLLPLILCARENPDNQSANDTTFQCVRERGIPHLKMATLSQANPRCSHRAQNEVFLEQDFVTDQVCRS